MDINANFHTKDRVTYDNTDTGRFKNPREHAGSLTSDTDLDLLLLLEGLSSSSSSSNCECVCGENKTSNQYMHTYCCTVHIQDTVRSK